MLGKKETKGEEPLRTRLIIGREGETARTFAARMFRPQGKNPYYKGDMAIRDLDELDRNLASFDAHEALWVADWLDYMGDPTTAVRIRNAPAEFKRIVHERREELRKFT